MNLYFYSRNDDTDAAYHHADLDDLGRIYCHAARAEVSRSTSTAHNDNNNNSNDSNDDNDNNDSVRIKPFS